MDEWLHALLAIVGDRERKEEVVRKVSVKTGLPPEKAELIVSAAINYLTNTSRAN